MADIKDHISVIRNNQDLLPGGPGEDFWPPHGWTHEAGNYDEISIADLHGVTADMQDAQWLRGIEIEDSVPLNGETLIYNDTAGEWQFGSPGVPGLHGWTHEFGGIDEIDVTDLSGLLGDPQDAGYFLGVELDNTGISDGKGYVYSTSTGNFELVDIVYGDYVISINSIYGALNLLGDDGIYIDTTSPNITISTRYPAVNGSGLNNIIDYFNFIQGPCKLDSSEGLITNGGSGTLNISSGSGIAKETDNENATTYYFDWSAATGVSIPDNNVSFIIVNYHPTTPYITTTTDPLAVTGRNKIFLGAVKREGTDLDIRNFDSQLSDMGLKIVLKSNTQANGKLEYGTGVILGDTGTRNLTVTEGIMFGGLVPLSTNAFDSSGSDTWTYYYYNPTTTQWVGVGSSTQINNQQYNNIVSGTGLATLGVNQYGIHWVYYDNSGDHLYIVYGTASYGTLAAAEEVPAPSFIPWQVDKWGFLIGRVIVKRGSNDLDVTSVFIEEVGGGAGVSNHNLLSGLQGGTVDEYYHLDSADYSDLTTNLPITQHAAVYGGISGELAHNVSIFCMDSINGYFGIDNSSPECGVHIGSGTSQFVTTSEDLIVSGDIELQGSIMTDSYLHTNHNTFLGYNVAGAGNLTHTTGDTGYYNSGIGSEALHNATTSSFNTAIGYHSLYYITSGSYNDAIGFEALNTLTSGNANNAFGMRALRYATGIQNSAFGHLAGDNLTTGSYCIAIGANTDFGSATADYQLVIGNTIYGLLNSDFIGINNSSPEVGLHIGTTSPTHLTPTTESLVVSGAAEIKNSVYVDVYYFGYNYTANAIPYWNASYRMDEDPTNFYYSETDFRVNPTNASGAASSYIGADATGAEADITIFADSDTTADLTAYARSSGGSVASADFYSYQTGTNNAITQIYSSSITSGTAQTLITSTGPLGYIAKIDLQGTGTIDFEADGNINFEDQYWSSFTNPMSFSDSSTEWDDIYTLGGSSDISLLGAILAAAASGGGGSEPDTQIVYGIGTGIDSASSFVYDYTNQEITITKSNSETNWYDADAACLYLTGTATQGVVIRANANFTIGDYRTSGDSDLKIISQTAGATDESFLGLYSYSAIGETNAPEGIFKIASSPTSNEYCYFEGKIDTSASTITIKANNTTSGDDSIINLQTVSSSGDAYIDITADWVDFNGAYLDDIGGYDTGLSYSITVSSNTFNYNSANGVGQRVSFSANTTWSLTTPGGCTRGTLWVSNTDSSAHTLTLTGSPTATFFGGYTDGFSIPANTEVLISIGYDTTKGWYIAPVEES